MTNAIHNVANLGVANPSPRPIRITTNSSSSVNVPWPSPVVGQKFPPTQEYPNLLGEAGSNTGNLNPLPNRG